MTTPPTKLAKIDISAVHTEAMATFYEAVLGLLLRPITVGPFTLYSGQLSDGLTFVIAPQEMTGAQSDRNRYQLNFCVADVAKSYQAALEHGGKELEPIAQHGSEQLASVWDPDGNSLILLQAQ